jgi:hypothetical protein
VNAEDAQETAREVTRSDPARRFARSGLAARALLYLLVGWLVLLLALGRPTNETDQRGAMQEVASYPGGFVLLAAVALGLAGFALWQFSDAVFGGRSGDADWKTRVASAGRGIVYAALAGSAISVLARAGRGSEARRQQSLTARVMQVPAGRWLVAAVGVAIVVVGLVLLYQGVTRRFRKDFDRATMPTWSHPVVWALGTVGSTARGLVFGLSGVLVVRAAWAYDPHDARGIDEALRQVGSTPGGRILVGAAGLGFIAFALYGFAEARWRRL